MPSMTLAQVADFTFGNTWDTLMNSLDLVRRPDEIVAMLESLPLVGAVVVTGVGAACVFKGYKWHKIVVVLLSLMLGFAVGRRLK